jgi:hypothetical protein
MKMTATMRIRFACGCALVLFVFLSLGPRANAQIKQSKKISAKCLPWMNRIDPALGKEPRETFPVPEQDLLTAMGCLLEAEGNDNPSRCEMNMTHNGSWPLPPPTVEIFALYYISYIFEEDWTYAVGIALIDRDKKINSPAAVRAAYRAYRKWYLKVRTIGVEQARKEHLQPLNQDRDGVNWFGGTKLY